jgi:hypothetical protein
METPNTLTSTLAALDKPEELRGGIQAELAKTIPVAQAKELVVHLVDTCGYDTPQALQEMDYKELNAAVLSIGHRKRVSRALFNGQTLQPAAEPAVTGAPPELNVTVTAPAQDKSWRIEWPETCTPETILDWGLQVRANLRRKDEAYSELVWGRYTKPWTDVDHTHTDGSDMDQHLSSCLLSVKIPEWAAPLVRNPLTQWHAILAVQAVCRQVFMRTDLSDKQLKKRVRDPEPESRIGGVALRLATWDSDLSTCVDVRKFTVDEHDRKEALKQIVEGLSVFKPALEAFANKTGGYTWKELRDRLGAVADEHRSISVSKKKSALTVVPAGSKKGKKTKEQRAVEAVAAVSKAMQKYPAPKTLLRRRSRRNNARSSATSSGTMATVDMETSVTSHMVRVVALVE